jgi:NADH-quinone oxidoreductase subunit L
MLLSETTTTGFFELVPWIVLFPAIGLLINTFMPLVMKAVKREWGETAVAITAVTASGLSLVVSVLQFISLRANHGHEVIVPFAEWLEIGTFRVPWEFRVDTLSVTMMLVVAGVGTLIHLYAVGYMHFDVQYKGDPKSYGRFFIYMNLFIAMMMILVSGNSYLMLFVGWEGVGLCSFLLIGFWYTKNPDATEGTENTYAAKKAFIANRVGDFGFLMAMFLTFWHFGTLQFDGVFEQAAHFHGSETLIWWITGFMLLGVTGKSAQIPLYVWLPDAMAGPTPVSALIHAATMVTAGVYLVARSAPLYMAVPDAQAVVAIVGAATALFAATIAAGQYDIKKVLAYSTISQLGFMVAAVGMGAFVAGMFHLITHAFFKALLFLSAGSVILGVERGHHHAAHHDHGHKKKNNHHEEVFDPGDMRNMGGMRKTMPTTYWLYMIGTIALAGLPIFAGFWSKDEILADAFKIGFGEGHSYGIWVYILLTLAAFLTAFYMGRQIWMVFFGKPRHEAAKHAQESPLIMTAPLMVLAFLSIFGGALNLPGLHTFTHWLEHTFEAFEVHLHAGEFNWGVAITSTVLALVAIWVSWLLYGRNPIKKGQPDPLKRILGPVFSGMENKWWVDEFYWAVLLNPYIALARFLAEVVDWQFWHDWFHDTVIAGFYNWLSNGLALQVDLGIIDATANGIASLTKRTAAGMRKLQTGFVRNYALSVFVGVVVILGYLIIR